MWEEAGCTKVTFCVQNHSQILRARVTFRMDICSVFAFNIMYLQYTAEVLEPFTNKQALKLSPG